MDRHSRSLPHILLRPLRRLRLHQRRLLQPLRERWPSRAGRTEGVLSWKGNGWEDTESVEGRARICGQALGVFGGGWISAQVSPFLLFFSGIRILRVDHVVSNRETQAWFICEDEGFTAKSVLAQMGDFSQEKSIAKHCARISLCFSTTREVPITPVIKRICDITNDTQYASLPFLPIFILARIT